MVTVVITTCKREPSIIERAISSVVEQTYKEWELVIVDDSPHDWKLRNEVKETVKSFSKDHRVKYFENESNYGACYSRNIGLKKANGDYIAYLDDDDEWLPDKLEKQVEAMKKASDEVALVYGPYYEENEETKERKNIDVPLLSGFLYEELMRQGNFFGGMSMPLMRTRCVIDVGGFDELMPAVQDMDLWLRIAMKYPVTSIPEPLTIYHVYAGEKISNNPQKKIAGLKRLNEKNKEYLEKDKRVHWRKNMVLIPYLLKANEQQEAFQLWREAVVLCPDKIKTNLRVFANILYSKRTK